MAEDPFETVLNLEDQFYQEGYQEGVSDGLQAGRTEGRSFGIEKGYEKFVEGGRLYGRAVIWANRLPNVPATKPESQGEGKPPKLPELSDNPRLRKNITTLYALVELDTLSTENTDEAVNDFDDRVKRAQGKAKVIEKAVGEESTQGQKASNNSATTTVADAP